MLFGRRTYEHFYKVWHGRTDNPYSAVLDNAHKYVASTTLKEPLAWQNSTLLTGDVPHAVSELKRGSGGDLVILGSGELIKSLTRDANSARQAEITQEIMEIVGGAEALSKTGSEG